MLRGVIKGGLLTYGCEVQHPWISKIRLKRKNREKITGSILKYLINRSFWNFLFIAICLNFKLWIHNNFVCPLHGNEKWAYFYVMEAKNGHFSVFSSFWKINWSKFFSRSHQNFFYNIWPKPTKISSKSIKLLLHKILWRFCQIGKWKFEQLH